MRQTFAFVSLALASVLPSCGSSSPATPPPATLSDGLAATCSPVRTSGVCMYPWPNAIYLEADASTKTGFRLALPQETLPVIAAKQNKPLDPARYNMADGFSPATPVLAYFPERIDVATLVPPSDPSKSQSPDAATILVDMDSKSLVLHFSELDQTVLQDFQKQALMIRPLKRLLPGHRYAVAITTSIKTVDGKLPTAPPLFAAIADGHAPSDAMSQKQAARMPDILAALKAAGVDRSKLVVAWDFVTGSDEYLTSHVLSMRDQALAAVGQNGIGYTITESTDNVNAQVMRRIRGTFTVPQFISQTDPTNPVATLTLDGAGKPVQKGTYEAPFTVIVPPIAATKPLPIILFGHGLLGTGDEALTGAAVQKLCAEKGYIAFATDWIGLSQHENPLAPGSNGAIGSALTDFNDIPFVSDRLQQAIVNAIVLARTMRGKIVTDAKMSANGKAFADPTKLTYWGISLGGIMGGAFMGYDPDITQGVLGVPGGFWSLLFQRSSQWPQFKLLIAGSYGDFADQQLLLSLAQMDFDFSDPATVAPHLLNDPLPGVPKKQIIIQMAVGDSQVPNLATFEMARTEQIPLLGPSVLPVFGIQPVTGPQTSGMSIWDVHAQPPAPLTNQTPDHDNGAHGAIHTLQPLQDQIDAFFTTGQVSNTCNGPCDFPK